MKYAPLLWIGLVLLLALAALLLHRPARRAQPTPVQPTATKRTHATAKAKPAIITQAPAPMKEAKKAPQKPSTPSERLVCDDSCKQEATGAHAKAATNYAVVSPVPRGTVEMIAQAPRLNTLEGKTIAIVGGSFMASVTHPEIKRLILEHYPTAKVLLLDEIGSGGVFPAPGITRRAKLEFEQKLRDMRVDAVISGNCGCGLCTAKEVGSCLTAEYMGLPTVTIAAPGFVEEVHTTARNNGVPVARVAEYPGAFATHSHEELRRHTRETLWPQIVDALTRPISEEERNAHAAKEGGGLRDDVFFGTLDEVNEHFRNMKWSDGLPIIPPTFEKVESYLPYAGMAWDESVAVLPVAHRNCTVWHVAVNGVMAGCKPEYMPILIAITKALGGPEFRRTLASTHAWMPYCWLNGPLARQLGVASGQGEISQEANVAIGRFINLALQNLSGYYVGSNRMGTFGYPLPWCLVEDDAACLSVKWQPYHTRQGLALNDSAVTMSSALSWGNNMAPSSTAAERVAELVAWDIAEHSQFALGSGMQFTCRTILITPPVARILAGKYPSPEALEEALLPLSRRPLKARIFARYYANPGSNPEEKHSIRRYGSYMARQEGAEMTPTPPWHDSPESELETVATMQPDMTAFIITGDESRNKLQTMQGGGYATEKIVLPANWDELVEKLGYRPLADFFLK